MNANLNTATDIYWCWCADVYILESWSWGKLELFSSAIDENNLGRPPRPGDLLQVRTVPCWTTPHNSWHVVRRVAIFGPRGAGNCVNQRGQIMPPHWLTPPAEEGYTASGQRRSAAHRNSAPVLQCSSAAHALRWEECCGETESPPSLLICNYGRLVVPARDQSAPKDYKTSKYVKL